MRYLAEKRDINVVVIGLGYVGSCIAGTLSDRGINVAGIDTNPALVDEIKNGICRFQEAGLAELIASGVATERLTATTDYEAAAEADVILITVGTPIADDRSLGDEQLRSACDALGPHLRHGQLVVVKSTVPPGTTRGVVLPHLERGGLAGGTDFGLAFTPERLAEGTAIEELRRFPIVAGGFDPGSTAAAAAFWRRALDVDIVEVPSLEAAEIVKLADNWWIDLNIALGNELAKFCSLYDVDSLDVIAAANGLPKGSGTVNILHPSVGVGGSCLTKDPWMVWHAAREHGLTIATAPAGREANDSMPEYTAQLAIDGLAELGRDPKSAKVAVLGLAFKNNTGDLRATPVAPAVAALARSFGQVAIHDPLVDREEATEVFGMEPTQSVLDTVRDADCVALLAYHAEFAGLDFATLPVARPCIILDGRAHLTKERIAGLTDLGYVYRGVGR